MFLEMEENYQSPDDCHVNLVYLETPKKRVTILTERYPSKQALIDAVGKTHTSLFARARQLCPAINAREEQNLAAVRDLSFEPIDVECNSCGAEPGSRCHGRNADACREDREHGLRCFLVWLAEQKLLADKKLTKARTRRVLDAMGIRVHAQNRWANPYDSTMGLAIQQPQTAVFWCLYVGGRVDATHSAWLTCGMNLSRPERGPFRDEREIAVALRAWGRGE